MNQEQLHSSDMESRDQLWKAVEDLLPNALITEHEAFGYVHGDLPEDEEAAIEELLQDSPELHAQLRQAREANLSLTEPSAEAMRQVEARFLEVLRADYPERFAKKDKPDNRGRARDPGKPRERVVLGLWGPAAVGKTSVTASILKYANQRVPVSLAASAQALQETVSLSATFPDFEAEWLNLRTDEEFCLYLGELMAPQHRRWFRACHDRVHRREEICCLPGMLQALRLLPRPLARMAQLHYRVGTALREVQRSVPEAIPALESLAWEFELPLGLILDIAWELATDPKRLEKARATGRVWHGDLRPAEREATLAGVVMTRHSDPERDHATLIFLTLEIFPGKDSEARSLSFFPAPAMALWDRDEAFRMAEETARRSVEHLLPGDRSLEVRWKLCRSSGLELPPKVSGPSLGLAFAFLLRRLLALPGDPVATVDLNGVAMTGALTDGGTGLSQVASAGDVIRKVFADGVDTIVAAACQLEHPYVQATDVPQIHTIRNGRVHILLISSLDEAAELLALDRQTRDLQISFQRPAPPTEVVGRQELTRNFLEFVDRTRSGYGVLVGSMGSGKTTFFRHLIDCLAQIGHRPVCHIVPPQPERDSLADNLVKSLYYRLRRTYVTAEPPAWSEWPMEKRLEQLLSDLSERLRPTREKVILVIDAADQLEFPARKKLLPGLLPRELPPGVICLISSNPGLNWLCDRGAVTRFFGMRESSLGVPACTNDQADVEAFLLAKQESHELSPALISRIVSGDTPPVFFTVVRRLAELKMPRLAPERRTELLQDAKLWLEPPMELIQRKIDLICEAVDPDGESDADVLQTLGVIALAREPLSEEHLRSLGLWRDRFTGKLLREAASFFFPRTSPSEPFQFVHHGYPLAIQGMLKEDGITACHSRLGERCLDWKEFEEPARSYALWRGPAHLRRAGRWDDLCDLLTNFEFHEERMTKAQRHAKEARPGTAASLQSSWRVVLRVVRDFEQALQGELRLPALHPCRPQIEALYQRLEQNMHVLRESPHLLVQQLYNALIWRWDGTTSLGGKLLRAISSHPQHVMLQRLNRPADSSGRLHFRRFEGHRGVVNAIALSPDQRTVASASQDGTVILWHVDSGEVVRILRHGTKPVSSVSWSCDGAWLASCSGQAQLWKTSNGDPSPFLDAGGNVCCVAFSPVEPQLLAIALEDGRVRLYNTARSEWASDLRPRGPAIFCLAFSSDGRMLATSGKDHSGHRGRVELYDVSKRCHRLTLPTFAYWVYCLDFSPDSKLLAIGGGVQKGEVRFFDVETGSFLRALDVHRSGVHALAISTDGRLVTGSWDHTVGVRSTSTGTLLLTGMAHAGIVTSVAISRKGDFVISGSEDHAVVLWHIDSSLEPQGTSRSTPSVRRAHHAILHSTRFFSDGTRVATASADGTARIFGLDPQDSAPVFTADGGVINVAIPSPQGDKLALGSCRLTKICSSFTGATEHVLQGHQSWVVDAAWTPDGKRLVTVSEDQTAMVWEVHSGAWIATLSGHSAALRTVAISPDGRYVATAGDDAKIGVWDLQTGGLVHRLHGHNLHIKVLAFSPDGMLASAGSDEFIKLWNPFTATEAGVINIGSSLPETWALAFAPPRFLAAGGTDGTARIFDLETLQPVAALPCLDAIQALSFSEDGSQFRVADRGGADLEPNIHITKLIHPQARTGL